MIITQKHLPRRTFLRGMGASLALPLLDGMVPAFAALRNSPARPVCRLGVVYVPNGILIDAWEPGPEGAAFELKQTLEALAPFRDRTLVLSGLCNKEADPRQGEGAGDHARASGAFLSGAHPKRTEGAEPPQAGVTMDQVAARALGEHTQLASLELALEPKDVVGACDPGYSCAYANTISWRTPTTPLPMENDPRAVFERLFGGTDSTDVAARLARIEEDRSILDVVTEKVAHLKRTLGPHDRTKMDAYLEAIRDVERRTQKAEEQSARELPAVERPGGIPPTFTEHAKLMFDLQLLAYQADLTRIITFMVGHETGARSYPEIGVVEPHHPLSHHGRNPDKMQKLAKVDAYHVKTFAYYLEKLAATPDGDGSLLDHVMILYGCGMSDGSRHDHHNLPLLLAGGGAGSLKAGRHIRYPHETPVTNLYLTLLDKLGVPTEAMGDSTGKVEHLSGV